ncbi:MAG: hypothetical protein U0T75_14580 [Chitinophagales bacterium]
MSNLLKKIKGLFNSALNSRPAKIATGVAYVAGGLLLLGGLMKVLTFTVHAFNGLAKAVNG